jgi:glycosyltransferase involved in cell wall biosynthesis
VVEGGRCAVLVPPRDPASFGAEVASVLADRGRAAELGARGREIFRSRFTLERSTERMVALCRRVARADIPARAADDGVEVA